MFVYGMNEQAKGLALDALTGTRCTVKAVRRAHMRKAPSGPCLFES